MQRGLAIYHAPPPSDYPSKRLVMEGETGNDAGFTFYERIDIGRFKEGRSQVGWLFVKDPTVSSRHCVVTQDPNGRCFVRDTSRNGTRLDGRRLSPNSKTAIAVGQVLAVGQELELRLEGEQAAERTARSAHESAETIGVSSSSIVSILVGDIRNFTTLVRQAPPAVLQASVSRVFRRLEREVVALGGTLKEFQGDALFAFWERGSATNHAAAACRAALELRRLVEELATNPSVWGVEGFPLEMDWAVTTGLVSISGYGGDAIMGLSMVGEPVVLAFRIEKLADATTGPILACPDTCMMASGSFEFKDLGMKEAKGFDAPQQVFALVGER